MSNSTTPFGLGVHQRRAAGRRQPRLGLAIDDLELEPDLLGDAGAELRAVLGRAAGLGRDQRARVRGRGSGPALHLVATDGKRLDGTAHGGITDATRGRYPLPEPDDAGEGVDHPEAVAGRTGDQQPAIIGAEIERGIGPPRRAPAGRARHPGAADHRASAARAAAAADRLVRPLSRRPESRPPVRRPSSLISCLPAAPKPPGSTAQHVQIQIGSTVARSRLGQQLRAGCMTVPIPPHLLVVAAGLLYLKPNLSGAVFRRVPRNPVRLASACAPPAAPDDLIKVLHS